MSDERQDPPQVGSVAEEAAALFAVLSGFARDHGSQYAGAASQAASHAMHAADDHLATGSPECTWCPICQVVHTIRTTSPEVKAHLATAANALVQAAASALATQTAPERTAPVQRIDLDDEPTTTEDES